jgi:hypothetical protein
VSFFGQKVFSPAFIFSYCDITISRSELRAGKKLKFWNLENIFEINFLYAKNLLKIYEKFIKAVQKNPTKSTLPHNMEPIIIMCDEKSIKHSVMG